MERFIGIGGIFFLLGIAYLISNNKKQIKLRVIIWGISLQIFLGLLLLKIPFVKSKFSIIDKIFQKLISFSDAGGDFLFKSFVPGIGYHNAMVNFAFRALPVVIFFSSLISVFYYFGIIQFIIKWIARIM